MQAVLALEATLRVIITGAAGRIGRELVAELSGDHELRLIDIAATQGPRSIRADLSSAGIRRKWFAWGTGGGRRWEEAFRGTDVVLHLAANADPAATWEAVLRHNIGATWNVLEAAAHHAVRQVVLASSCRGVLGLEPEPVSAGQPRSARIGSETQPRPRTPYGLSKACSEFAGRMFVDQGRLRSVAAVRIGAFRQREPQDRDVRDRWVQPADLRKIFRRCVEVTFEGFHVLYAVSPTPGGRFDLSHTHALLGLTAKEG